MRDRLRLRLLVVGALGTALVLVAVLAAIAQIVSSPVKYIPFPTPSSTPAPVCPPTFKDLDQQIRCEVALLPAGSFVWNPPRTLRLGEHAIVTARIGMIPPGQLGSGIEGPGTPTGGPIPVSSVMAVDLTSDDASSLKVDSLDPAHREQLTTATDERKFAEWKWRLTANASGTWRLRLKGYVILKEQAIQVREVEFLTRVEDVQVGFDLRTSVQSFWSSYWQWLIGTVIAALPVLAGILALRRKNEPATRPVPTPLVPPPPSPGPRRPPRGGGRRRP